jgi:tetratricopeptide (TPR) repeat protein
VKKSREYIARGDEYALAGKVREAAIEYRNALKYKPDSLEAHEKLAEVATRGNDPMTALAEYMRIADLDPADTAAQVRAAAVSLLAGDFDDARDRAESALRTTPRDANAHMALGQALAALHDQKRGLENLTEAVKLAPSSPAAHIALASACWASGDRARAESEMKRAIQLTPSDALANRGLALLLMATGRTVDAEPYWKVVASAPDGDPLALADYYGAANRWPEAERQLKALADAPTTRDAASVRLAAVLFVRGDRGGARAIVEALLARSPRNLPGQLLHAKLLEADGRLDDALAAARLVATIDSSMAASLLQGDILAAQGHDDQAVQAFEAAASANGSDATPPLAIGRIRLKQGRFPEAIDAAERARARRANDPAVALVLIDALSGAGQFERAEYETRAAMAEWPRVADFHTRLGRIALASERSGEAQHAFESALSLAPRSLDALAGLTAVDIKMKRVNQASARIDAELRQHPRDPGLLLLAAQTSAAAGDTRKAEATLKQVIETDPTRFEPFAVLGGLYLQDGRLSDAREEFVKASARSTTPSPATMVGLILESEGNRAAARQQYEATVGKYPRAWIAANNLAWIDLDEGRLDDALRWAKMARDEMPQRAEVNDTLGWVQVRRGEVSQAVAALTRAVDLSPDNPTYHYHLGAAFARTGARSQALQELNRALHSPMGFAGRDEAAKLAAQLEKQAGQRSRR